MGNKSFQTYVRSPDGQLYGIEENGDVRKLPNEIRHCWQSISNVSHVLPIQEGAHITPDMLGHEGAHITPDVPGHEGAHITPDLPSHEGAHITPDVPGHEGAHITPDLPSHEGAHITP